MRSSRFAVNTPPQPSAAPPEGEPRVPRFPLWGKSRAAGIGVHLCGAAAISISRRGVAGQLKAQGSKLNALTSTYTHQATQTENHHPLSEMVVFCCRGCFMVWQVYLTACHGSPYFSTAAGTAPAGSFSAAVASLSAFALLRSKRSDTNP